MLRWSDVQREVARVHLLFSSTEFTLIQWQEFFVRQIHSAIQGILCSSETRSFLVDTAGLQGAVYDFFAQSVLCLIK